MISIIDYGAGNLRSVKKAFDYLEVDSKIISKRQELDYAEKVVLPGVGAFGAAVNKLYEHGFYEALIEWINADKPFLGICLGMQLLLESSAETSGSKGLGIIKGNNLQFKKGKVPQIGWNQINFEKHSRLFTEIADNSFFYFLHGYYINPDNNNIVTAATRYGIKYPSVIERGNMFAVQFHPEKSGVNGLKLLKNWVNFEFNC